MLPNLLPGLRHTRTPLVTGGLWLLIAWLILGDRVLPDADGSRVEGLLYDLGTLIGGSVLVAALALLATLIGGMTPRLPVRLIARHLPINQAGRWQPVAVCWFFGIEPDLVDARGEFDSWLFRRVSLAPEEVEWAHFTGEDCPPVLQLAARDIQEHGSARIGRDRLSKTDFVGDDPTPYDWLRWGLAEASIRTELAEELPVQLRVERESLFNEYDRIRAESELRAAIVLPLLVLVAILTAESWLWVCALVVPIWLFRQAVQSFVGAEQRLLSAVRFGVIQSSTVAFVDSLRTNRTTEPN